MFKINQIVCITFVCLISISISKAGRKNKYDVAAPSPPPPPITYDISGNCYVNSLGLRGRCARYQDCSSAVQNWQYYHKLPISCYYTAYDNFVCCPEAFVTPSKTVIPPTSAPSYYSNPFLSDISSNPKLLAPRISEQECSSIYQQHLLPYRHHRSKRSPKTNRLNETLDETSSEPVQEEVIEKEQVKETQLVGGVNTHRNEFPFMCALGWRKSSSKRADVVYNCGCVLIARRYVLTAAHCATMGGESPKLVRLGGANLEEDHAELIKIQRIIQHPDYDPKMAYNDIAVVKLERSSREVPACLWPNDGLPQEVVTALGYGQTQFGGPSSNTLQKITLKVITNENCHAYYKSGDKLQYGVDAGQICAGDANNKMDTCQGDSGGPLLITQYKYNSYVPYIVGLTSFGEGGCASGVPSVYTRISHFIDWLENEVWK